MSRDTNYAGGALPRYLLLGTTVFLLLGGLVMVYSAAFVSDFVNFADSTHHLKRQAMWVIAGLVLLAVVMRLDYRKLKSLSWWVYGVSVMGLLAVIPFGVEKWGAKRWIDLGFSSIQPSEYAKLGCVMLTAYLLTQLEDRRIGPKEFWGQLIVAISAVTLLVMVQPDMGTTMSILLAVYVVLLLGGVSLRVVSGIAVAGMAAVGAAITLAPYRAARFLAYLDPWADPQGGGYQTIQALLAFGSGGVDGIGLGMSRQKFFYLPAAHTDFIFAIIGEELGLIGTLTVVVAFIVFAYAGMRIALATKDSFGRLLAGGLTAMIILQAVMNMAAVTNIMPVTGIPMPLVSFGGSSMTFTMLCIGLILSVSRYGSLGVHAVHGPRKKENAGASGLERRGNGRPHLSSVGGGRSSSRRRA